MVCFQKNVIEKLIIKTEKKNAQTEHKLADWDAIHHHN